MLVLQSSAPYGPEAAFLQGLNSKCWNSFLVAVSEDAA